MFGSRLALCAVVALTIGAGTVLAIEPVSCGASVNAVDFQDTYYWEYDDSSVYDVSWSYDPSLCTTPNSTIAVNSVRLYNEVSGDTITCTYQQFSTSGRYIHSECTLTRGQMAVQARDSGENDWSVEIAIGRRPSTASVRKYFYIGPPASPAPQPSGAMKKKRDSEEQHRFDCPVGQTSCWTGQRQDYACMDTSSDVTACGRCPFAPDVGGVVGDCTSIEGADDVQCKNSRCVVNACQRGFQISTDRSKCLDGRKRSKVARGVLF